VGLSDSLVGGAVSGSSADMWGRLRLVAGLAGLGNVWPLVWASGSGAEGAVPLVPAVD